MNRYMITSPAGNTATCDLNPAAVAQYAPGTARYAAGWRLAFLGPSLVTVVRDDAAVDPTAPTVDVDVDVIAELAPIGVQLWPTITPASAPNFTLDSVAIVRDSNGEHVVWTYQSGSTRYFRKGERIASRVAVAAGGTS